MSKQKKVVPSPNKDKNNGCDPYTKTMHAGAVRSKTVAGIPKEAFPPGKTQPPLQEDIDKKAETRTNGLPRTIIREDKLLILEEEIGEGGQGSIFKATEVFRGRTIGKRAVKVVQLGSNPDLTERFINEIVAVKVLKEKEDKGRKTDIIIRIFDYGETNITPDSNEVGPYFSMELLKGKDLGHIIKEQGTLPWQMVKHIMLQVCTALRYAHEYKEDEEKDEKKGKKDEEKGGIIHRDIKPKNIFLVDVEGEERVKVLDFGIAKITGYKRNETQAGMVFGTFEYMSPEQAEGNTKKIDHRTDIYSVGAVMYELLTGMTALVFKGGPLEILRTIEKNSIRPFDETGVDVPPEVARIVLKCLQKKPKKRYQTVKDLMDDIKSCEVVDENEIKTAIVPMPVRPPEPWEVPPEAGIPNGPLQAEETESVLLYEPQKPRRSRIRQLRYQLLIIGAAALAIGVTISALILKSKGEEKARKPAQITRVVDASPEKPVSKNLPLAEPALDSGIAPDMQPEKREHTIILKFNIRGVKVLKGGKLLCRPSRKKRCSFKLPEDKEPVEITLLARGFRRKTIRVLPDSDDVITVLLKRKKRKYLIYEE